MYLNIGSMWEKRRNGKGKEKKSRIREKKKELNQVFVTDFRGIYDYKEELILVDIDNQIQDPINLYS